MPRTAPRSSACRRCRSPRRSTAWRRERTDGAPGRPHGEVGMVKAAVNARTRARGATVAIVAIALGVMSGRASAANVTEVNAGRSDLSVFLLEGPIVGGETLTLES